MLLLKKARIFDQRSKHHLKQVDLLVEKGKITRIGRSIKSTPKTKIVESKNLCVSPGWLDIGCFNGEPGLEYREDLNSLLNAAAQGGYCSVAPFPTCEPTVDSKAQLAYLINASAAHSVDLLPIASISMNRNGDDIAELLDLNQAGAVAFSDGSQSKLDQQGLLRSLLYLKKVRGLTIYGACPVSRGVVHEGAISVQMGLEGMPGHLETEHVLGAIEQARYAGGKLLLHNLSSSESVKHVKNIANVQSTVSFMNLTHNDEELLEFDLNLKVHPPIRNEKDRKALCKAVANGQIQAITSNHQPLSKEEKDQPFGMSQPGAATLENVFSVLNTYCDELSLEQIVYALSIGPAGVLGITTPHVAEGEDAKLTFFDSSIEFENDSSKLFTKSKNNPYLGHQLSGKPLGIINGSRYHFSS